MFVSLLPRLVTGEVLSGTPTATVLATGVSVATVAKNTVKLSSIDGTVIAPINTAVQFIITTGKEVNSSTGIPIRIGYATTASNSGYVDALLYITTSPEVS